MNPSLTKFVIVALAGIAGLSACKSSDDETDSTDVYSAANASSSTMVTSFNIKPNTKVLANLDSVFFSIDQVNATIYNADSLPWGTDVRKLVMNVGLPTSASASVVMPSLENGQSVTVELTDSINFSGNGVWLRVTSADGDRERVYSVKVNVHACNPDSLQWQATSTPLPCSTLAGFTEQSTVAFKGQFLCIARSPAQTMLYTASNPAATQWDAIGLTELGDSVVLSTLSASADALYALSIDNDLLCSTDGLTWNKVALGWDHLYGVYGSNAVGVKDGKWITYPDNRTGAIPDGMPVEGTSALWTFTNDWAIAPQALFIGGRDAQGRLSTNAWGFDGNNWTQLSGMMNSDMLPAAEGMTLFPYFTFKINGGNYMANRQSAWIALGGKLADGTINNKVYVSLNNGLNWHEAPEGLQLPAEIAPRTGASVVLDNRTFTASRAIKPITQWDAPYIYMFGGYDASGKIYDQLWTGVINRLTFKPLQ